MDEPLRALFLKLRKARKWTQEELEAESGVSQGLISRIEKDPDYQPTTDVFFRVVKGLGLTLSEFFLHAEAGGTESARVTAPAHHAPAPEPATTRVATTAADELSKAGTALLAAASYLRKTQRPARAVREARRDKSGRARRGA